MMGSQMLEMEMKKGDKQEGGHKLWKMNKKLSLGLKFRYTKNQFTHNRTTSPSLISFLPSLSEVSSPVWDFVAKQNCAYVKFGSDLIPTSNSSDVLGPALVMGHTQTHIHAPEDGFHFTAVPSSYQRGREIKPSTTVWSSISCTLSYRLPITPSSPLFYLSVTPLFLTYLLYALRDLWPLLYVPVLSLLIIIVCSRSHPGPTENCSRR